LSYNNAAEAQRRNAKLERTRSARKQEKNLHRYGFDLLVNGEHFDVTDTFDRGVPPSRSGGGERGD
jgi:hypothetical protein